MRAIIATAFFLALAACDAAPPEPAVTVERAAVTLPVIPGRPGAAYFTLRTNNQPTRLVSVASPSIERIELHETRLEGGVSRMAPITERGDLTFAGDVMEFKPGGRHAMLFGIDPAVKPGGKIALTFTFEPLPPVTVQADVRAAGDAGHSGH